jgi:hypothetical protein
MNENEKDTEPNDRTATLRTDWQGADESRYRGATVQLEQAQACALYP